MKRSPKRTPAPLVAAPPGVETDRLYRKVARQLFDELAAGKYAVGDRLPGERDLALQYKVSRPAVREAMIALEVQGFIEVRVGSGAYVQRLPGHDDRPGFNITAFELMEARLLFEGEAAALAAVHISDLELDELDACVDRIADENRRPGNTEKADRAFHRLIAEASRNAAVLRVVEDLWRLRSSSPECALLLEKARTASVQPVVDEHRAIVEALRSRNPATARNAMRAHLRAVIDHLLFAVEAQAVEAARRNVESTRKRYARAADL